MPTARCLCNNIRLEIDNIIATGICHCMTCRQYTGSIYAINAVCSKEDFRVVSGEPKTYKNPCPSGAHADINFCGDCGSTMYTLYSGTPGLISVKAGVLDGEGAFDHEKLKPMGEQFTVRRPKWLQPLEGTLQYEKMPNVEDVKEIMANMHASDKK